MEKMFSKNISSVIFIIIDRFIDIKSTPNKKITGINFIDDYGIILIELNVGKSIGEWNSI